MIPTAMYPCNYGMTGGPYGLHNYTYSNGVVVCSQCGDEPDQGLRKRKEIAAKIRAAKTNGDVVGDETWNDGMERAARIVEGAA